MRTGKMLFVMVAVLAVAGAAGAQTLLIPATPISKSADDCTAIANPVQCIPALGVNEVNINKAWVFKEATVWVQCGEDPYAKLVDELGMPPVVDNYMTVNDDNTSVCVGGVDDNNPIANSNCFRSGSGSFTNVGLPIVPIFQPTFSDVNLAVTPGINQLNVRLWDFGVVYGNTPIYLDTDCKICDELIIDSETAWAFGDRYVSRGNWATYTEYFGEPMTVDLFAGKDMYAGMVSFSAPVNGFVTITIQLEPTWRFAEGDEENLHIQPYYTAEGGVPGENPAPGLFDYKSFEDSEFGGTATAIVPVADFYGIHAALEHVVGCVSREYVCADFAQYGAGASVEGAGAVLEGLDISTPTGGAKVLLPGDATAVTYGAPNTACGKTSIKNGCMDPEDGGFGDVNAAGTTAHFYTFTFEEAVEDFSLRMLDYGDFNYPRGTVFSAIMTAYDADGVTVDQEVLEFATQAATNPTSSDFGNLLCGNGDACDAPAGQPGNYTWNVSGEGITKVELFFDPLKAYDPNIGFDNLCYERTVTYYYDND